VNKKTKEIINWHIFTKTCGKNFISNQSVIQRSKSTNILNYFMTTKGLLTYSTFTRTRFTYVFKVPKRFSTYTVVSPPTLVLRIQKKRNEQSYWLLLQASAEAEGGFPLIKSERNTRYY